MTGFLKLHKNAVIISIISIVVLYYHHAVSSNINIDVEQFIIGEYGKEWLVDGLGRFALYYMVMLLNLGSYNVYLNGILFLLIFSAATIAWAYTFYIYHGKIFSWQIVVFSIGFASYPIWMYQFYFTHQQVAIAVALLLQSCSFILLYASFKEFKVNSANGKSIILMVLSVFCSFWAFGTYQAFVPMHMAEAAALLMLMFDREPEYKSEFKRITIFAVHFLVSFGLYEAVCKTMRWGTSEYLDNNWGDGSSISAVFADLFEDYKNILLGKDKYCGYLLMISLIVLIGMIVKYKGVENKIIFVALLLGNALTMCSLNIVMGSVAQDRARIAVCFSVAFLAIFSLGKLFEDFNKNGVTKSIFVLTVTICAVSIFMQIGRVERLIYTEDICEQQQRKVAFDICRDILAETGDKSSKLVFVGKWNAPLNGSSEISGIIGRSSFRHGYKKNDITGASRRAVLYLNASNGTSFIEGSDEEKQLAIEISSSMPAYPGGGYIKREGDLIVIKLSNEGN